MDKRPIMNKWYTRFLSVALILAVVCGMSWPGKIMVADAEEGGTTVVTAGDIVSGEVTPGNALDGGSVVDTGAGGDTNEAEESLAEQYLVEIAALMAEAQLIDGTSADVTLKCADVYERLMEVYNEAFTAYENDLLTDEEIEEVNNAAGAVMEVLGGYGYDPYAVSTLADTGEKMEEDYYWNNTSTIEEFYWRVVGDYSQASTASNGDEISKHVRVSYNNNLNNTVPYSTYDSRGSVTLKCKDVAGTDKSDDSFTLHIETDVGYVVTSYRIACEKPGQYGENCKTVASNAGLIISLDTTGLYKSSIDVEYNVEAFGHMTSDGRGGTPNYVLLLTVAEVNVNLKVDKVADRESVAAGESINYTVTATTTNDLTNVQFADEFLKKAEIISVSYGSASLEKVNSNSSFTYAETPSKYYLDSTNGVLYINGKWTNECTITIQYSYATTTEQANSTITNTVIATGTKTNTTDTVEDMGVAQVNVIVNEADKGSVRIYKTFSGLLTDEVIGTSEITGVLSNFKLVLTKVDGNEAITLSGPTISASQTTTEPYSYTYFWDATGLKPGTYKVTETGYTVEGYTCVSTYIVKVSNTESSGTGTELSAGVEAGKTTIIQLTNSYVNAEIAVKVVKQWQDAAGKTITLTEKDSLPTVILNLCADGEEIHQFELDVSDLSTDENAWIEYFVLDEKYLNSKLTVTEDDIDGYKLAKVITAETGQIYTVITTITEKDEEGNETVREESKTYDCTVFTAVNKISTTNVTVKKEVTGGFGDWSKLFAFEAEIYKGSEKYELKDGEYENYKISNGLITFSLAHGNEVELADIPIGSKLVLKEIADGYDVTVKAGDLVVAPNEEGEYEITVSEGLQITFINSKEAVPDTGVLLDSLPYVLILIIVIAGVVVMLIRKRRSYDED